MLLGAVGDEILYSWPFKKKKKTFKFGIKERVSWIEMVIIFMAIFFFERIPFQVLNLRALK